MDIGAETLAAIYLICGFVFGVWFTYQKFRGGADSQYYREARRKVPGFDALNPWVHFFGAALGVVVYAIVWPYPLAVNLVAMRRARRHAVLYKHPRIAKLRKQLAGREEQYEQILTTFGLREVVTALHALDLNSVVEHGLDRIVERKREQGEVDPPRPAADDYEPATYVNVIRGVIPYTELRALEQTKTRANTIQCMKIADDLSERFDSFRNACISIGELIVFRIHGWAPMPMMTTVKQKYVQHLKPEFNNADHLAEVFDNIRVVDERDVNRVPDKKADITEEEEDRMIAEHRARKAKASASQSDDRTARTSNDDETART